MKTLLVVLALLAPMVHLPVALAPAGFAPAVFAPLESLDVVVRHDVQAARTPLLDPVARLLSDKLGRPQVTLGLLLGLCVFGGPAGVETARVALATLIPLNLVVEGVKRATERTRPDGTHDRNNASFPSSHSANVFALMTVFARRWRRGAPFFLLFAACMAFSRIYLNRHWFSDVIVGSLLGLFGAWLIGGWWERWRRRPPPVTRPAVAEGPFV